MDESDLKELNERIDLFRSSRGWPCFDPKDKGELVKWLAKDTAIGDVNEPPLVRLENWVHKNQPEEPAFTNMLQKAAEASNHVLTTEFEALEANFESWFAPMSPEERRYEGAARLQESCQKIIQNAARAFEAPILLASQSANPLNLPARHPEIPQSLIVSGVGSMAFGIVLFPGAPIWLMLSGLGVGLGSILSGRKILDTQRDDLSKKQLEQAKEYLSAVRLESSASFQALQKQLLEGHQKTNSSGWTAELAQQ
jgi:hypothetical protein